MDFINKPFYHRHRDDDGYDDISIKIKERYKTSGMSGDEWRFSYILQFKRKGEILFERYFGSLKAAVAALPWFYLVAGEQEEYDMKAMQRTEKKCSQPGCCNDATSEYRMKKRFSREGYENIPSYEIRARFCDRHLKRGDCGLEDADSNYQVVVGKGPEAQNWKDANITESAQVMVNIDSLDQIGEAVKEAVNLVKPVPEVKH